MMLSSTYLTLLGALTALSPVQAAPQASASPTSSSATASSTSSSSSSDKACNNSPDLCSQKYNQVTYMGAHDSAFLRDDSTDNSLAGNQYKNATLALDAGLRFLQAQVHDANGTLELCHSSCDILDAGPLEDWLAKIATWVDGHPNDVVTVLLVNSDSIDASEFGQAFDGAGLADYAYKPATQGATGDWPTLQSMIDKNERLVSFVTNIDASSAYPYIMSEFDYVFETAYEVTELTGFNCTLDRPSGQGSATTALGANYLSLVNHFKYQTVTSDVFLPDVGNIDTVNSAGTDEDGELGTHLEQCTSEWGQKPNFVLVDFWSKGDVVEAADNANGLTDTTGREASGSGGDGDSAAATQTALSLPYMAVLAVFTSTILLA